MFRKLIADQSGASAIEYGLIAALITALITVAAIAAFSAMWQNVDGLFSEVR